MEMLVEVIMVVEGIIIFCNFKTLRDKKSNKKK